MAHHRFASVLALTAGLVLFACGGPSEPASAPVVAATAPPPPSSSAPAPAPAPAPTPVRAAEPPKGLSLAVYKRACDPVALTQTLDSQLLGFKVGYPAGWAVTMPAPDLPLLVKTGTEAQVAASHFNNGRPDLRTLDIIRETKDVAANGQWKEIAIGGRPAATYWYTRQQPHPMCAGCTTPIGPDLAQLTLTVSMPNDSFVELQGSAPLTAPTATFCEIQAILASFTIR